MIYFIFSMVLAFILGAPWPVIVAMFLGYETIAYLARKQEKDEKAYEETASR